MAKANLNTTNKITIGEFLHAKQILVAFLNERQKIQGTWSTAAVFLKKVTYRAFDVNKPNNANEFVLEEQEDLKLKYAMIGTDGELLYDNIIAEGKLISREMKISPVKQKEFRKANKELFLKSIPCHLEIKKANFSELHPNEKALFINTWQAEVQEDCYDYLHVIFTNLPSYE